ncbi:MAG: hypothetical protein QOF08_2103, partial [Gaiellales bacterium]|nr:hypothetical protein [Gaiellales bacterium]
MAGGFGELSDRSRRATLSEQRIDVVGWSLGNQADAPKQMCARRVAAHA